MADHDVDPAKAEEERLMRALSRQGKPGAGRPTIAKKVEPAAEPVAQKKEAAPAGSIPKWKQAQMEREAEEKKRREEEAKKKEEQAKLIEERVKEFGLGANQEDETIANYLTSPRGEAQKPTVAAPKPAFEDPVAQRAAAEAAAKEEEMKYIPSYDERGNDERAAKEEERLMKMIGAQK